MAKEGFSLTAIEEKQQLIKGPQAEVWEEKKRGVVFPGHNPVEAAMDRHPAMVREIQTDGCLPGRNGTATNPQTRWNCIGMTAPPPQPAPPRPWIPAAPPDHNKRTQSSETEGVPPGYVYIHTPLPSAQFFNLDPYTKDRMRDNDFILDLLTDEGASTG